MISYPSIKNNLSLCFVLISVCGLATGCSLFLEKDLQENAQTQAGSASDAYEIPVGAIPMGFLNAQQAGDTFSNIMDVDYAASTFTNTGVYGTYFAPVKDVLPKWGDGLELSNPNPLFAYQFLADGFCKTRLDLEAGYSTTDSRRIFLKGINLTQQVSSTGDQEVVDFVDRFAARAWGYSDSTERALVVDFAAQSKADFSNKLNLFKAVCLLLMSSTSTLVN